MPKEEVKVYSTKDEALDIKQNRRQPAILGAGIGLIRETPGRTKNIA